MFNFMISYGVEGAADPVMKLRRGRRGRIVRRGSVSAASSSATSFQACWECPLIFCRGLGIRAPEKCYSGVLTMELRSSTAYTPPSFWRLQSHSLNYLLLSYFLQVVLQFVSNSNPHGDPVLPVLNARVPRGRRPACLSRSRPTLGPAIPDFLASRCSFAQYTLLALSNLLQPSNVC